MNVFCTARYANATVLTQRACDRAYTSYRLIHHSMLDASCGDGIILGASSPQQLAANLNACVGAGSGPLPSAVVEAFEAAWERTASSCPTYYSGYSGMNVGAAAL